MKHLCCSKFILIFLLLVSTSFALETKKSAIVYYGKDISYANVGIHDYIIIEPDNISSYTHGFKTYKKKIYAYVSIGEASEHRKYFKDIKAEWIIAENKAWNSKVLDISNDEFHAFFFANVIQPLVDKGHENFFFDTLDSYQIAAKDDTERKKYELGLIRFIKKFKQKYPKAKLIVNRGFEVMDEIHENIDAVLFESLFYGLSSPNLSYSKVSQDDRTWLLEQVKMIKSYDLDVIAVDYIDVNEKEKINKTVKDIQALDVIPYISNKELTRYGASSKTVVKREVLIMYNSDVKKQLSNAHHMLSLPLEYLGYVPVLKRIEDGLADDDELSRYKAVVVWAQLPIKEEQAYTKWIKSLIRQDIKVLFIDGFGIVNDTALAKSLGITKVSNRADILEKQTIVYKSKIFDFESFLMLNFASTLYQPHNAEKLLVLSNAYNQEHSPVAKMPWGGYSLSGLSTVSSGEDTLWTINPYDFVQSMLELDVIPVPDPTTENGRRLLFTHIDGDAAMNRAEWNPKLYSIGVMYDKILKKYTIPQSVSIVEAEMDALYPKDTLALEKEAKKIYNLPYVEAATHTYTHPFVWSEIKDDNLSPEFRLKVKGYDFSLEREVKGSLNYINTKLLPKGKTPANTVYWTGDCMPEEETLKYLYENDILNINGGDTIITNDKPWLSLVAPYGIKRGEFRQVYTGAENENVYTNDWLGPFWGFKKVIQTFKLTNEPRRLKPINIYYHFYAASKNASLSALTEVYDWALEQKTMPIYTSEYIPKVMEFYDVSMMKVDNNWYFDGMKNLRNLRLSKELKEVSFKDSISIVGEKKEKTVRYIYVDTATTPIKLSLKDKKEDENYLVDSNAKLYNFKNEAKKTSFSLRSYVKLELNYHLKKGCSLSSVPKAQKSSRNGSILSLKYKQKEADIVIECR